MIYVLVSPKNTQLMTKNTFMLKRRIHFARLIFLRNSSIWAVHSSVTEQNFQTDEMEGYSRDWKIP